LYDLPEARKTQNVLRLMILYTIVAAYFDTQVTLHSCYNVPDGIPDMFFTDNILIYSNTIKNTSSVEEDTFTLKGQK
jgi:hypothetical protein